MKLLIVLALVGACLAYEGKDAMLSSNRIDVDVVDSKNTCDQCVGIVKRFINAAEDEKKMRELKLLLSALCHETSYETECLVFVKNIDYIIKRVKPYIEDGVKVCKAFHLCANPRLDAFHRIGLLYAKKAIDQVEGIKDLACDQCQFAATELKQFVEDKEKQKSIKEFFAKNICIHAYSYRGMCDMLVEQFLPSFFQELDAILQDTKKACSSIGFCPKGANTTRLTSIPHEKSSLRAFWAGAKTLQTSQGIVLKSCLDCELEYEGVLSGLEKDRNELSKKIQDFACDSLLPANFSASCQDFLSLYLPTVLYMTIKQVDPRDICVRQHVCDPQSAINMNALSMDEKKSLKQQACDDTMDYLKNALLEKEVQHNAVASIHSNQCQAVPSYWREACFTLSARLVPRFMETASVVASSHVLCQ